MLKIKGSDTVLPLASAWAEAYMNKHPDAVIAVNGGGSGVGFASLINGTCDIANASRECKPKEVTQGRDRNVIDERQLLFPLDDDYFSRLVASV